MELGMNTESITLDRLERGIILLSTMCIQKMQACIKSKWRMYLFSQLSWTLNVRFELDMGNGQL